MKKYIYMIVITGLLIGCGDKPDEPTVDLKEADITQIKITQGQKRVEQVEVTPKEAIEKDEKGFYYAYNEDAKKENLEDTTHTRIDAQAHVKNRVIDGKIAVVEKGTTFDNPYEYVRLDLLKTALSKNFIVKCSSCHDNYANGIIGPSLLRKDGNYIYGQLIKYRNDPTKNVLMRDLVNNMTEAELKKIADEIALFNKEIRALKGK